MVRADGAGRHVEADRRQAASGDDEILGHAGRAPEAREPRSAARRQHARRVRTGRAHRDAGLGQGHPERRHQDERMIRATTGDFVMSSIRILVLMLLACLMIPSAAAQTNYPDKPIRFIVGFTAGSATDITARLFAQKLQDAWGVAVTVENVPGAGGSVGGDRVAKSAPDGTTFYWG